MARQDRLFSSDNSNRDNNLSLEQIRDLLGQYTVEAMEAIDKENARRDQILKNSKSTSEERAAALGAGVWYAEDYLVFLKRYPARLKWMLEKNILKDGYLPNKVWKSEGIYSFTWELQDDVSPSRAILDIVEGKSLYILDCMTVFNIAQYTALIKLWGEEKFDRVFSGKEEFTLPLRISSYVKCNPIYLFLEGEQASNLSSVHIGDKMGITNHPAYQFKHPLGAAPSWNILCAELVPEIKFVGFGFDGKRINEKELKLVLIDNYNVPPLQSQIEKLKVEAERQQHGLFKPLFPDTIDLDGFERSGAGYDCKITRLSAERVKMILDMPLESANFFGVYSKLSEVQQVYVMSPVLKQEWDGAGVNGESNVLSRKG